MKDISSLIRNRLKEDQVTFLNSVAAAAAHDQLNAYVVGGFVRDLLLNIKSLDIDLVVEGDGISFAETLAEKLHGQTVSYEEFGTSTLMLKNQPNIDVATARTENYPHPAALPKVEPSNIQLDLARRDFTINSMAIKLCGKGIFSLIDLHDGENDLKNGLIRILHDRSFIDDPCRIFRAIRFEQRFEFCVEGQTQSHIKTAIEDNLIGQLSGDRLINEIKLLLNEPDPMKCVHRMKEFLLLQKVAPEIFEEDFNWIIMERVRGVLAWAETISIPMEPEAWFVYFYILFMVKEDDVFESMMARMHFPSNIYDRMCLDRECLAQAMLDLNKERDLKPSEVYDIFSNQSSEGAVLLLSVYPSNRVKKYAELYFEQYYASAEIELNGNDLIGMGIEPGPIFNDVLKALRDARVNGQIKSRDEEIFLVESEFLK